MKHYEIFVDGEHQTTWVARSASQAALEWGQRYGVAKVTARQVGTQITETVEVTKASAPELPADATVDPVETPWFKRLLGKK